MLQIKDLTVKVEDKIVLKDFNLTIDDGVISVIMGPNGAGKSSLTKVIMADPNYKVLKGDIIYNGKSIINLTTDLRAKLGIFLAMQNPPVIDGVTNSDFLRTAVSSINEKNVNLYSFIKKIDKSLEELSMPNEMIHRSVNKGFSGGERKKNEILQMYLLNPNTILLDEIDSGLDMDSLKIVGKSVMDYYEEYKPAILLITHYQRLLNYIKPTHVHIMRDGKIIKSGDIKLVKEVEEKGYDAIEVYE